MKFAYEFSQIFSNGCIFQFERFENRIQISSCPFFISSTTRLCVLGANEPFKQVGLWVARVILEALVVPGILEAVLRTICDNTVGMTARLGVEYIFRLSKLFH